MTETAYLTADQLDAALHGPDACQLGTPGRSWARNDDGSAPLRCAHSGRRIDPTTGLCGYHQAVTWNRGNLRSLTYRYDGTRFYVVPTVPAYPALAARARPRSL